MISVFLPVFLPTPGGWRSSEVVCLARVGMRETLELVVFVCLNDVSETVDKADRVHAVSRKNLLQIGDFSVSK